MKTVKRLSAFLTILVLLTGVMSFLPKAKSADAKYLSKMVSISIKGTSSLHDWEMTSSEGKCETVLVIGDNNKISSLKELHFSIASQSLKSGHKQMDKNTYKALKTSDYPNIAFDLSSATVSEVDANTYQIRCTGKLSIAGTTHETELVADAKWNASGNSYIFSGSKKMKMTDYNVKPPTVMMGTIKTGDAIVLSYNLTLAN